MYDESTSEWTVTGKLTNAQTGGSGVLTATNANWITIKESTGLHATRTKVSPVEVTDSKIEVKVTVDAGYEPVDVTDSENNKIVEYTENTDGSYTAKIDPSKVTGGEVTLTAQGAPKATLAPTGEYAKEITLPSFNSDLVMEVNIDWDEEAGKGEIVFEGIKIANGYRLSDIKVKKAAGEGSATAVDGTKTKLQEDGTWTITIPVSERADYSVTVEGVATHRMRVVSNDANIIIDGDGYSDYDAGEGVKLTIKVADDKRLVERSVVIGGVAAAESPVIYTNMGASGGYLTYELSLASEELDSGDAVVTLATESLGDAVKVKLEAVENTNGDAWENAGGFFPTGADAEKYTEGDTVQFEIMIRDGYMPKAGELKAEETEEAGLSAYALTNEVDVAFDVVYGGDFNTWTITVSNVSKADVSGADGASGQADGDETVYVLPIGLVKSAELVSRGDEMWSALEEEMKTSPYEDENVKEYLVQFMDYVTDSLKVTGSMDGDKYVFDVTGTVSPWIDKDWWESAGKLLGERKKSVIIFNDGETESLANEEEAEANYAGILGYMFGKNNWAWTGEGTECIVGQLNTYGEGLGVTEESKVGFIVLNMPTVESQFDGESSEANESESETWIVPVVDGGYVTMTYGGITFEVHFDVSYGEKAQDWFIPAGAVDISTDSDTETGNTVTE